MIFKILAIVAFVSAPAIAKPIQALATIPDLAWLMKEIGGDDVEASSMLSGKENPHYVDALPSYTLKAANAQIVCMVGMDLEVGYIGPILSRSGNAQVQAGSPYYCDASKRVKILDKITGPVDRSMGDVHPHGNPHYYLSPSAMSDAATEIAGILGKISSDKKPSFEKRLSTLKTKLSEIAKLNKDKLKNTDRSQSWIIEYHREFSYFYEEYELSSFGSIEEKPGIEPSAGRIAKIALEAKKAGVKVVLATDYSPANVLKRFSEISGIPVLRVPTMIQSGTTTDTYEKVQAYIVDGLLKHLPQKKLSYAPPPKR